MKKKNFITAFLLILAVSFSSCEDRRCISFTHITKCEAGRCYPEGFEKVITSQEEWDYFISPCISPSFEMKIDIDFDRYLVIAVFDKPRPSGNWRMSITRIKEYSNRIEVVVTIGNPKVLNTLGFIHSYHIVKIPATRKDIIFKYNYKTA